MAAEEKCECPVCRETEIDIDFSDASEMLASGLFGAQVGGISPQQPVQALKDMVLTGRNSE